MRMHVEYESIKNGTVQKCVGNLVCAWKLW